MKSHSCSSKFYCTSERSKCKTSPTKWILNFASKVNLMFSMKRHLVWLENILFPISCLTCVGFLLLRMLHCWYFSINLELSQSWCLWLSGPHSLNCQTYLSSAGLDRNVSCSHDAPALGCTSLRKLECISFKESVCNLFWQHILQSTLQSIPQAVFSVSLIFTLCIELKLCHLSLAVL